ncbi:hypothetical protein [Methylocystis iwaonis]|uniref:hypothetical protein n=1 Tax=Methylocystis iwaonis TaxID=2885079 RepID=UPI002E7AB22C|nr:hypothetical protein [Methylocystis iwaonis]
MLKSAHDLLIRHSKSGVFFDTNLMVVFVVGSYKPELLGKHRRTQAFDIAEYRLLLSLLERCEKRLTTPNILTEVDNLSRQLPSNDHSEISKHLNALATQMFEIYNQSLEHLGGELHSKVGLTDSILVHHSADHLVVTADFPLASRIETMRRNVINFNHIRHYAV